jgi:hypothetical protein
MNWADMSHQSGLGLHATSTTQSVCECGYQGWKRQGQQIRPNLKNRNENNDHDECRNQAVLGCD